MSTPAPGRVIVIDDERDVCELVGKVLLREGYDVVTAQTGEQGLELIKQGLVKCLVVDKQLPGLGGLEVIVEARRLMPTVPVVLMTAHPEPFQLGDARPTSVLTKPFANLKAVIDAVAGAIESTRVEVGPLAQLRERVVAVVNEIAPGLKKRDPE